MNNFYKRHIFFCNNIRKDDKPCCSKFNAKEFYRYTKDKCRELKIMGENQIGVSESRCLGRCGVGAKIVIYPDNIWYQYNNTHDIDEIIAKHLIKGQVVKRLQI